ncbi:hydroxyacylglutathione hydrolase [Amphibiibacter pelophylacis]|uniref:Hydroxyacylglutathione hydrolase n=1 Tax=Amphibiibacter pelophylacis TaxID=1799477 RepID=A0ACC6P3S7_9BURK
MFYCPTPALQDNVIWILGAGEKPRAGDPAPERATPVLVVDPGEADALHQSLLDQHLALHAIVVTHHHGDHVGGIARLLALWPQALLVDAQPQHSRLGDDLALLSGRIVTPQPGQTLVLPGLDGLRIDVLAVPGHTLDHLAYVVTGPGCDDAPLLLCGDTLFSAGCGRMFEGTPAQFADSLARLAALPDDTRVLCAHEYTLSNLRFAQAVEPGNAEIAAHTAWAQQQRAQGLYTLATELRQEKRINPFLRLGEAAVIAAARREGARGSDPVSVFAALREWKNRF